MKGWGVCRVLVLASAVMLLAACSPFTYLNASVPADSVDERSDLAYGSLQRQKLDVFVPRSSPYRPAPVVVFFYGGAWDSGSKEDYRFVARALGARGIATVIPDYRLYPAVAFPDFLEDAAAAVAWSIRHAEQYGADPSRVFLMGHSAGAYIAAMLALNQDYLAAEGISPRELRGWIGLSGPYDFLPLRSHRLKRIFGDPAATSTQPINYVSAAAPPALLITGDADTTVIPRNTYRLAERLRGAGAKVEKIQYPDVGHAMTVAAFSGWGDGIPVVDDVENFIRSFETEAAVPPRGAQ